ncbi:hypothetical protein CPB83DRAFT_851223 [Crepidotus variabilis]|uniref:Uncharacterized protein n=1 Tax=Crepidotus variabilis TaxID=179855 RepID=A0A9P6JRF8_9AGAR|nr:hypothetical protein CPB83DRAFT_851223 [Crepidotus variabilis]
MTSETGHPTRSTRIFLTLGSYGFTSGMIIPSNSTFFPQKIYRRYALWLSCYHLEIAEQHDLLQSV